MTTYRLWPSTNGGALVSFGGSFIAGTTFEVAPGVKWLDGYWWWVPTGGDTGAQKFALWVETTNSTGSVVSGSVVTSGTLSATPTGGESGGHWNFVPLPISVPLAPGTAYIAATGWTAVNGFPDTGGYWASGGGGQNGIVNGPLIAFSSATSGGLTHQAPWAGGQGVFSTAGTDPSLVLPLSQSGSDNFWVDVQVNDSPAAAYAGSYRLWPNNTAGNPSVTVDASVNYGVAMEFSLSRACTVSKIWYFSPATATQLATAASIWAVTAPGTSGTLVATNASPSWSGAAASGWISCTLSGVTLPPGDYKVSVYNGAATPAGAFAKDSQTDPWRNGDLASGITNGPLSAPNLSSASLAFNYNNNPAGSPPFSDGTTLAGQSTFFQNTGGSDGYPYLYAPVATPTAGSTQNYFVDLEVTPVPVVAISPATAKPGRTWLRRFHHPRQVIPQAPAAAVTVPGAATLTAAGSISAPAAQDAGATLSAAGALTAAAAQGSGAALSGAASLTAPDATQGAGATLTAAGSIAAPDSAQAAGATLAAAGSVNAPDVTQTAGASLAAAGSLTAAAQQDAGATLAGTASLSAAAVQQAGASLTAAGSLTAPATQAAGAALAAAGSLSTSADLEAGASLAAAGTIGSSATQQAGAALAAAGAISTAATLKAGALLAGTGSIFASPGGQTPGAATLAAAGSLTAPAGIQGAGASLAATGTLAAPESVLQATADFAAVGLLTAGSGQEAGAELVGAGSVTATASGGGGKDRSRGFLGVFP